MTTGLIWAQSENGVIGANGAMPWRVPEDLAHFKATTLGDAVLMGRKTWDSLPPAARPLPGRTNVVITRQPGWRADGSIACDTIDSGFRAVDGSDLWVIGGAQIYAVTIGEADRLEVTEIRGSFDGDTFAPSIDDDWIRTSPVGGEWLRSRSGLDYRFVSYAREPASKRRTRA